VASFDTWMTRLERRFFPQARGWVCGRASGATLEIAIGTGLNLGLYPPGIQLTGVDQQPAALDFARRRADELGRTVSLSRADALALPFADTSFDTVVCTFALCEMPDVPAALREAIRVLRPGGSLLLADHVVSTTLVLRIGQRLLEQITIPASGEHFTRRPCLDLPGAGATLVESHRSWHGVIELVHATKP
jgi:ubiquinone/menaquinone biosynthesis C-methylase UbiE